VRLRLRDVCGVPLIATYAGANLARLALFITRQNSAAGNSTYKDNYAAGTAFMVIRRSDTKGLQLTKPGDHAMVAYVSAVQRRTDRLE
jgi:hypothetical protein